MNDRYYERVRRELAARMEAFGYAARGDVEDTEDESASWYFDEAQNLKKVKVTEVPNGYDSGHAFASALAEMFVAKPGISYSKVVNVARKFAAWEGFRGLEDGMEYISGFTDGFFSAQPKQITEKAE